MPHDSPILRVYTLRSDEGRMQHNELMDLVTKLSDRVVALETYLRQTKKVYSAAYTKLIKKVKKLERAAKSSQSRRRANIMVSNDEDDAEDSSKQERKIDEIDQDPNVTLIQHDVEIQGSHGQEIETETEVYTAEDVSTTGATVTTAGGVLTKDQCMDKMDESKQSKLRKVAAKTRNELEDIQATIEAGEELAQRIQAKEGEKYSEAEKARLLEDTYLRSEKDILPNKELKKGGTSHLYKLNRELISRSSKKDVEEELNQGSSKRQNTGENSELVEESKEKEDDELSQEELQQLMTIVPEEGMNVEALQTKYPTIDLEIYTEDSRMYWKIIKVERFNSIDPTEIQDNYALGRVLRRLFEPDVDDDELWKSQKHVHDITWRLYDTCGVHHVSTKDGIDIYMLVEKEYPLLRGVLTQMLAAKLLVEQNNEMCRELLRKIFMMAERPKR
ncbi:hypothetical protein Tco_1252890 [Tanacetum coccineum]